MASQDAGAANVFSLIPVILILSAVNAQAADMLLIDDFKDNTGLSRLGTPWRLVTDRVMGGVSVAEMSLKEIDGRRALCMLGQVSLENNGGFVQVALDLDRAGYLDASAYIGIRIVVRGNDEPYSLHLKTAHTRLPWQSYRSTFKADTEWRAIHLPFHGFEPHRVDALLDTARLSRLGLVAIGRPFTAEFCLGQISLY